MKKFLFTLALLVSFNSFGQDKLLDRFKNDIEDQISYTNDRNWDKVMSYSFPEMFNFITKEQMIEFFESSESSGIKVKPSNPTNFSISEPIEFDGATYYRVDYKNNITIKLSGEMLNNKDAIIDNLYNAFINKVDQFDFNEETNSIYVTGNKVISIARKTNPYNDYWKYIEVNESPMLKELVPILVLRKLKL
tara:strand:+ start:64 stop:639 length:576 start_codon:yes stop_codon:yes gene_type:complete